MIISRCTCYECIFKNCEIPNVEVEKRVTRWPLACFVESVKLEWTFCEGSKACQMQCLVSALIFWGLVPVKRFSRTSLMAALAVATPLVWAARSFLKALPTSLHRISGRMLRLTSLGLLLLPVDRFCWCWIPWFSAVGSRAYGQTLTFCSQTQWLSCGISSSQSDLRSSLLRGWSNMQPRFKQPQNSTPENKESQAYWPVPSRRLHISDPKRIKNTGGILY